MLQTQQILCDCYQLKQKLGSSAGRQTWLAQDLCIEEKVVVKLLCFSDQVHWENLRLFEREAQVLKQLHHPQIPKYYNYFCVDERILWFGLVQQYIPASSLKELLAQGKIFTEIEARKIAKDVLNILVYLHGLSPPVLHRDIKPSNLLWSENFQIYLVDFGAVQDHAAREGATFTVVGTYGYAPLEQFGGRATLSSDLYALGATLIHLLTGIAPADLPNEDSRLQFAHLASLNPGFVRWLEKMTDPNLEKRFSSASQALAVLNTNETAISTIVNPQPPNSQIKLKKTPGRLQIKIPAFWLGRRMNFVFFIYLFGVPLLLLLLDNIRFLGSGYGIWLSCICWLSVSPTMIRLLLETNLYFNEQQFEIESKLLGFRFRRQRGKVLDIDKIFAQDNEVVLAVGIREYSFYCLGEPQSLWLIAEIKQWLGLQ